MQSRPECGVPCQSLVVFHCCKLQLFFILLSAYTIIKTKQRYIRIRIRIRHLHVWINQRSSSNTSFLLPPNFFLPLLLDSAHRLCVRFPVPSLGRRHCMGMSVTQCHPMAEMDIYAGLICLLSTTVHVDARFAIEFTLDAK